MANYLETGDPNIIQKVFTGITTINLGGFISRYNEIKTQYLEDISVAKTNASKLYTDLKPIYDAGFLPTGFTTQYLQLETFVTE